MKGYETVFITETGLSEEVLNGMLGKFRNVVEKFNGKIESEHVWGSRRLAYTIKKKDFGVYHLWYIIGNGELLSELNRQFRYTDEVLRFQTIYVDDIEVERQFFKELMSSNKERKPIPDDILEIIIEDEIDDLPIIDDTEIITAL
ncbi:30S ribosomal protein S6 [Deltaproteobacteria bacterium TL4]